MQALRRLLALEYNCTPEDFDRPDTVLTVPALHEGRRQYTAEPYFFHMVTLGGNVVITADASLHAELRECLGGQQGHSLFELPQLLRIGGVLERHGCRLTPTHHMFLPARTVQITPDFPVRWFCDSEIRPFYGDPRFPNAICHEFLPERPDRIVVCAYDGDTIMGMAGCSEDAPHWQQIGIDVLPPYRSRGIGTALVTLLKNRIAAQGDIPFYGAAVANYHSWNIALNSGFRPAWVEVGASRIPVPSGGEIAGII